MRRLDRYVLAEITGPLGLGFLIYTFMLLLHRLFKLADLIIGSGVAPATVGKLLLLSLPNVIVLTIPTAMLFGILIAVGRLAADSELVAMRANGISLFSLYRPILLLSTVLTALNAFLMLEVLPDGNHALEKLQIEIVTAELSQEVEPRIPHTGWENRMLYVFEAPPGDRRWKGTLLADAIPGNEMRLHVAEWGEARMAPDRSHVVLNLTNVSTHQVDVTRPDPYNVVSHKTFSLTLRARHGHEAATSIRRSLRAMRLRDLQQVAADPGRYTSIRRLAWVEIHKKFSIPAACLVFGLLALPLGFSGVRGGGGRSSGFAISIGVILFYYVLLHSGEVFAGKGVVAPWLAVWLPNVALLAIGAYLLTRRNRDKSLLLTHFDRWFRERRSRSIAGRRARQQRRRPDTAMRRAQADLVIRLPEIGLPFPTLMDRYVLRTFVRVLLLAAGSGLAVYVIADLTGIADSILRNDPSSGVIFDYYKYKSFAILYEIAPLTVLVATLVSFGLLSRSNEITACKALGMSLYRLSIPVVLAAALIAGLCGLLQAEVLAASNDRAAALKAVIKGRDTPRSYQRADQRWLYGTNGGFLYNYTYYDEKRQEVHRLQVFKFDRRYRLTDRLFVERARYLGDGWWTFSRGWAATFEGTFSSVRSFAEPRKERLPESPEFFQGDVRRPRQMHYSELRDHIRELRRFGGHDVPALEVELYNKIAYPAISLVMALVALPFAFRLGRKGALYGIGLSLGLGIVLLVFLAFFSALGTNAILPPLVAVWSPNVIFTIFSLYLFLGVRT